MKPDFYTMPRAELKAYVLEHRDDEEAVQALMKRRSPDSEATWYGSSESEDGFEQTQEIIRRKINGEL